MAVPHGSIALKKPETMKVRPIIVLAIWAVIFNALLSAAVILAIISLIMFYLHSNIGATFDQIFSKITFGADISPDSATQLIMLNVVSLSAAER